jgi:hypothetical protein
MTGLQVLLPYVVPPFGAERIAPDAVACSTRLTVSLILPADSATLQ